MAVEIVWTEPVLQDLKVIVSYIESEWSEKLADKFVDELLIKIKTLSVQPYMGMVSAKFPAVRSIKVSRHNRLYYRIENDLLVLLNIFDLRRHPDKNIYS